jgi:hypothetical protein
MDLNDFGYGEIKGIIMACMVILSYFLLTIQMPPFMRGPLMCAQHGQ